MLLLPNIQFDNREWQCPYRMIDRRTLQRGCQLHLKNGEDAGLLSVVGRRYNVLVGILIDVYDITSAQKHCGTNYIPLVCNSSDDKPGDDRSFTLCSYWAKYWN